MLDDGSLTTDEKEINDKVNQHFQNIAKPRFDLSNDIPDDWKIHYAPRHIDRMIYDTQLTTIDIDELNNILNQCPNGKAAGVSGITYELLKHSSKQFKHYLLMLFNGCLKAGLTPTN